MTLMRDAALELAAGGWSVFPCIPTGPRAKSPLTEHGHLEASRDPEVIMVWWDRWPDAMIGAPVPDSLMVLDFDPRNGGNVGVLEALAGALPETLTAWSGRGDGGQHLYFKRPFGELTSTRLPKGIDLKVNGYCILPPSIHPASGKPYTWEIHQPALLPSRVRELLRSLHPQRVLRPGGTRDGGPLVRLVLSLQDGERNRGLYWAACRAAEDGILGAITEELVSGATSTGLAEREARGVIASAARTVGVKR